MAILEEYNVNTVGMLREYHGNSVGMMWEYSGNAMAIIWYECGILGGSTVGILYKRGGNIIIA